MCIVVGTHSFSFYTYVGYDLWLFWPSSSCLCLSLDLGVRELVVCHLIRHHLLFHYVLFCSRYKYIQTSISFESTLIHRGLKTWNQSLGAFCVLLCFPLIPVIIISLYFFVYIVIFGCWLTCLSGIRQKSSHPIFGLRSERVQKILHDIHSSNNRLNYN